MDADGTGWRVFKGNRFNTEVPEEEMQQLWNVVSV
jgi:hypothetical protein